MNSPEKVVAAIVEAMRRLPPPKWTQHSDFKDRSNTWWLDEMNPVWLAEEYLSFLGSEDAAPTARERDLVSEVKKKAMALTLLMRSFSSRGLSASYAKLNQSTYSGHKPDYLDLETALFDLATAASQVDFAVTRGNRPLSDRVHDVATLAASHYFRITWKTPTRTTWREPARRSGAAPTKKAARNIPGGLFLEFLSALYEALGINASAEDNAKKAIASFKTLQQARSFEERYPAAARIVVLPEDMEAKEGKAEE